MKVSNGYVWSNKYKGWRKLPRRVWHRIMQQQRTKAMPAKPPETNEPREPKT